MTDTLLAQQLASFQHLPADLPPRLRPIVAEALRRRLCRLAVHRQEADWGEVLDGWRHIRSGQALAVNPTGSCCGADPCGV